MSPYNVRPEDCAPHVEAYPAEWDYWENHGWCVRGADGAREYMLWSGLYVVRGHRHGMYVDGDLRIPQTVLVHGEFDASAKRTMRDNDFTIWGAHASREEYLEPDALRVDRTGDRVSWALGGREHVSAPPLWWVRGRHGDVDLDLELEAAAPAWWVDDVYASGLRGFQVTARARGSIVADGVTIDVDADAEHEKYHWPFAPRTREQARAAMTGRGAGGWARPAEQSVWHCGFHPRLRFFVQTGASVTAGGLPLCRVVADGRPLEVDAVSVEELEHWLDPRSGFTVPTAYRVRLSGPEGRVELDVRCYARAYYVWDYQRYEYAILYWFVADAEGVCVLGDRELAIEGMRYVAHTNRPFLAWAPPEREDDGGGGA